MPQTIEAFTDGACKGNPGPGGWGALLVIDGKHHELYGGDLNTTNNRMELMAAIKALEAVEPGTPIVITTDSQYVRKGVTEWIHGWKRNNWRTSAKKPVKNADLWKYLDAQAAQRSVRWEWVKGHSGHPGNEKADELANKGVAGLSKCITELPVPDTGAPGMLEFYPWPEDQSHPKDLPLGELLLVELAIPERSASSVIPDRETKPRYRVAEFTKNPSGQVIGLVGDSFAFDRTIKRWARLGHLIPDANAGRAGKTTKEGA